MNHQRRARRRDAGSGEASALWTDVAGGYAEARPSPPPALLDLLTRLLRQPHPALVVDLGSGTGCSTAIWAERAAHVIGIEPNADMRAAAVRHLDGRPDAARIEYREGLASRTGLPDGCADIVTAAQSFHWMEPSATLAEVARILRPGGLFAAYDYDWPLTVDWELDLLVQACAKRYKELARERGLTRSVPLWSADGHLERMRASGRFRFTREVLLHHSEPGDAARLLELIVSHAVVQQFSEEELGLDHLRRVAVQAIGNEPTPWHFGYRVRLGIT